MKTWFVIITVGRDLRIAAFHVGRHRRSWDRRLLATLGPPRFLDDVFSLLGCCGPHNGWSFSSQQILVARNRQVELLSTLKLPKADGTTKISMMSVLDVLRCKSPLRPQDIAKEMRVGEGRVKRALKPLLEIGVITVAKAKHAAWYSIAWHNIAFKPGAEDASPFDDLVLFIERDFQIDELVAFLNLLRDSECAIRPPSNAAFVSAWGHATNRLGVTVLENILADDEPFGGPSP